jgi:hypothetical protein
MAATRAPGFLGRTSERDLLHRLLVNVRGAQSAVLVIRGEARYRVEARAAAAAVAGGVSGIVSGV